MKAMQPSREAWRHPDGNWRVTVTPPPWSGYSASTVILSPELYERYLQWLSGKLPKIQEALPSLTAAEREMLLSGIDPVEWDETMGPDE